MGEKKKDKRRGGGDAMGREGENAKAVYKGSQQEVETKRGKEKVKRRMGQKVKGYRRGSDYGRRTNRKGRKVGGGDGYGGWAFAVNPVGTYGWTQGSAATSEGRYGAQWRNRRRRRKGVEEVRASHGCVSNGCGVQGTPSAGLVVHGEYRVLGKGDAGLEKKRAASLSRRVVHYRKRWGCGRRRNRRSVGDRRAFHGEEKEVVRLVEGTAGRRKRSGATPSERAGTAVTRENRAQAVARSGRRPSEVRRAKRIARELEGTLHHREVRRERKARMSRHATSSGKGRQDGSMFTAKDGARDGYRGYKVTVKGVLGGSMRTMTYRDQKGVMPRGTKRARRGGHDEVAKTTVGTRGVRVEYCYGRG